MKKILISAAVASMMMVGCQNKDIVSEISDNGEMFTLEINQGTGSRTEWGQNGETRWSTGDKIYVTSEDGTVTGVLTFQGGNKFKGFVYGGDASKLTHVLYPVPENGQIKINQPTGNKIGLPMMGELNQSKTGANLDNLCALVKMPVEGVKDVTLADEGGLLTGHYEYNDGEIVFVPGEGNVIIPVVDGAALFATSTQDEAGNTVNEVEITVNNGTDTYFIPVTQGEIETEDVPSIEISGNEVEATMNVTTEAILEKALNEYDEVKLADDITIVEGVTVAAETVTLDLNGFALTGTLTFEGENNTIAIIDSSEVYKRNASNISFSATNGVSVNIHGGSFTSDITAMLNEDVYFCVQNGEQWVVLPKNEVITHGGDNQTSGQNLYNKLSSGGRYYLTAGTYQWTDNSNNRFKDKSFELKGLEDAVISVSAKGVVCQSTIENKHVVTLKNLKIISGTQAIYAKGYMTMNLYDIVCETGNETAMILCSAELKDQVGETYQGGGTVTINATRVTIDEGDLIKLSAYPRMNTSMELVSYARFNFKDCVNINSENCVPDGTLKDNNLSCSNGNNLFVNGVALPAYKTPEAEQ